MRNSNSKILKIMSQVTVLLLLAVFTLTACDKEDVPPEKPGGKTEEPGKPEDPDNPGGEDPSDPDDPSNPTEVARTIFMYLPWSTNLLPFFQTNISDLETVVLQGLLKNERILVFVSTTASKAELFEMVYADGKSVRRTLKTYTNPPFTTAEGISSILNDVKSIAPARQYAMTIGCHGMGWLPVPGTLSRSVQQKRHWEYEGVPLTRYFGGLSREYQTDITTLADGIEQAGMKMEYILFDDCYMSTVEVAYELREVTGHFIASPCEIMAYGMPYAEIGPYLVGEVNYDGISNAFYEFYKNYEGIPCGTIGVTVCSELDNLAAIMREINSQYTFDSSLRNSVQRLDGYSPTIFFDFGDYVAKLCNDPALLTRFEEQLERTAPAKWQRHTDTYYSMQGGEARISAYSGLTISDPSIDSEAASAKTGTAWYKATH